MTLIKSISGIRGTIGGKAGEGLTPIDIIKYATAYGIWIKQRSQNLNVIVGRDARLSGHMVNNLVIGALNGIGIHVIDIGVSTTPTVEIAVTEEKAAGGIILTASHNPKQWNALKLLNENGEFISEADGSLILEIAEQQDIDFSNIDEIGSYHFMAGYIDSHIEKILALPLVDKDVIKKRKFKIVVDAVNSSGGIAVPKLLRALGVEEIVEIFCEPNGKFPHNPEPLAEHLTELSMEVKRSAAHLGIAVDPDVDRLAFVCEDGEMFGEEYTLVAVADYILKHKKGNTVSNLSSTKALKDITLKHGGSYFASAVGEVNVVKAMKDNHAVIGGEGNGGIIYPDLHYGRDALVGIALFLTHLAQTGKSIKMMRMSFPNYIISKNKIELTPDVNLDLIFKKIEEKYNKQPINKIDGLKIEFGDEWVHLRKSNTEPIIRIYAESQTETMANNLADKIKADIKNIIM